MAKNLNLIKEVSNRTKLLGLITIIGESILLSAFLLNLEAGIDRTILIIGAVTFPTISFFLIFLLEWKRKESYVGTPETEQKSSLFLKNLIIAALETVCRAVSLPQDPGKAGIRVFIFKKEGNELVCKYSWSMNPIEEVVDVLKFEIDVETAREVAVVRSAISRETEESEIKPISRELRESKRVQGDIKEQIKFVLARPIFTDESKQKVWGIVDFDTSTDSGMETLKQEMARATIYKLSTVLSTMFRMGVEDPDQTIEN